MTLKKIKTFITDMKIGPEHTSLAFTQNKDIVIAGRENTVTILTKDTNFNHD